MLKDLCEENMLRYFCLEQSPFTAHEEWCAKLSGLKECNKFFETVTEGSSQKISYHSWHRWQTERCSFQAYMEVKGLELAHRIRFHCANCGKSVDTITLRCQVWWSRSAWTKATTMTNCGTGSNCLHRCHLKMCGTTPDLSNWEKLRCHLKSKGESGFGSLE